MEEPEVEVEVVNDTSDENRVEGSVAVETLKDAIAGEKADDEVETIDYAYSEAPMEKKEEEMDSDSDDDAWMYTHKKLGTLVNDKDRSEISIKKETKNESAEKKIKGEAAEDHHKVA
jgi:hypothetical protein